MGFCTSAFFRKSNTGAVSVTRSSFWGIWVQGIHGQSLMASMAAFAMWEGQSIHDQHLLTGAFCCVCSSCHRYRRGFLAWEGSGAMPPHAKYDNMHVPANSVGEASSSRNLRASHMRSLNCTTFRGSTCLVIVTLLLCCCYLSAYGLCTELIPVIRVIRA